MSDVKKRIAIIGAGASGLPSIRHALLYNLEPVCFELTNDIGGLWRYKSEDRNCKGVNLSSVMKSTVINTSKEMTAYSDFPPKAEIANFMHNSEMLQYLRDYAENYQLKKYIKFNHKVLSIDRSEDFSKSGKWKITFLNEKDIENVEIFDGVLLASGHHAEPRLPNPPFPGQDIYEGDISHSHDYHSHRGYEDKIIAVVGIGNSGGDLAVELSRIAKQVYLVTRRGTWVCNRLLNGGYPRDASMTRKDIFLRGITSFDKLNDTLEAKLNQSINHEAYGLKPKHRFLSAHPTCNDELANRLANKTVKIKPNIKEFTQNGIIFDDVTEVPKVDAVIFATGYKFNFPLIEKGNLIPVKENEVSLYLNMFAPELSEHNSLAILGLVQAWGSIMPISEIQSRLFFDAFTGGTKLPKQNEMLKLIDESYAELQKRYVKTPRHTIQVDFGVYMDKIGGILGCKPNLLKLMFTDPVLAWTLWTSPPVSCTYRLCGPKPWKHARETIIGMKERIYRGMAPDGKIIQRKIEHTLNYSRFFTITFIAAIAIGVYSKKIQYQDFVDNFNKFIG